MDFLYDMNESILLLRNKLDDLVVKEPIKSNSNLKTEFGYYVEEYLGLKKNDLPIADFCGIEIKCMKNNSKYPLKLFTCEFDGDGIFLSKELFNRYSIINTHGKRTFNHSFYSNKYTYLDENIFGKLNVDYKNKKVILEIFSRKRVIETKYYWTFDLLYNHLIDKMNYMSVIYYDAYFVNKEKYYVVEKYSIFKLRSFEDFINMLATGKIIVCFSMDSSNDDYGIEKLHNHGIGFYVSKENFRLLYKKI